MSITDIIKHVDTIKTLYENHQLIIPFINDTFLIQDKASIINLMADYDDFHFDKIKEVIIPSQANLDIIDKSVNVDLIELSAYIDTDCMKFIGPGKYIYEEFVNNYNLARYYAKRTELNMPVYHVYFKCIDKIQENWTHIRPMIKQTTNNNKKILTYYDNFFKLNTLFKTEYKQYLAHVKIFIKTINDINSSNDCSDIIQFINACYILYNNTQHINIYIEQLKKTYYAYIYYQYLDFKNNTYAEKIYNNFVNQFNLCIVAYINYVFMNYEITSYNTVKSFDMIKPDNIFEIAKIILTNNFTRQNLNVTSKDGKRKCVIANYPSTFELLLSRFAKVANPDYSYDIISEKFRDIFNYDIINGMPLYTYIYTEPKQCQLLEFLLYEDNKIIYSDTRINYYYLNIDPTVNERCDVMLPRDKCDLSDYITLLCDWFNKYVKSPESHTIYLAKEWYTYKIGRDAHINQQTITDIDKEIAKLTPKLVDAVARTTIDEKKYDTIKANVSAIINKYLADLNNSYNDQIAAAETERTNIKTSHPAIYAALRNSIAYLKTKYAPLLNTYVIKNQYKTNLMSKIILAKKIIDIFSRDPNEDNYIITCKFIVTASQLLNDVPHAGDELTFINDAVKTDEKNIKNLVACTKKINALNTNKKHYDGRDPNFISILTDSLNNYIKQLDDDKNYDSDTAKTIIDKQLKPMFKPEFKTPETTAPYNDMIDQIVNFYDDEVIMIMELPKLTAKNIADEAQIKFLTEYKDRLKAIIPAEKLKDFEPKFTITDKESGDPYIYTEFAHEISKLLSKYSSSFDVTDYNINKSIKHLLNIELSLSYDNLEQLIRCYNMLMPNAPINIGELSIKTDMKDGMVFLIYIDFSYMDDESILKIKSKINSNDNMAYVTNETEIAPALNKDKVLIFTDNRSIDVLDHYSIKFETNLRYFSMIDKKYGIIISLFNSDTMKYNDESPPYDGGGNFFMFNIEFKHINDIITLYELLGHKINIYDAICVLYKDKDIIIDKLRTTLTMKDYNNKEINKKDKPYETYFYNLFTGLRDTPPENLDIGSIFKHLSEIKKEMTEKTYRCKQCNSRVIELMPCKKCGLTPGLFADEIIKMLKSKHDYDYDYSKQSINALIQLEFFLVNNYYKLDNEVVKFKALLKAYLGLLVFEDTKYNNLIKNIIITRPYYDVINITDVSADIKVSKLTNMIDFFFKCIETESYRQKTVDSINRDNEINGKDKIDRNGFYDYKTKQLLKNSTMIMSILLFIISIIKSIELQDITKLGSLLGMATLSSLLSTIIISVMFPFIKAKKQYIIIIFILCLIFFYTSFMFHVTETNNDANNAYWAFDGIIMLVFIILAGFVIKNSVCKNKMMGKNYVIPATFMPQFIVIVCLLLGPFIGNKLIFGDYNSLGLTFGPMLLGIIYSMTYNKDEDIINELKEENMKFDKTKPETLVIGVDPIRLDAGAGDSLKPAVPTSGSPTSSHRSTGTSTPSPPPSPPKPAVPRGILKAPTYKAKQVMKVPVSTSSSSSRPPRSTDTSTPSPLESAGTSTRSAIVASLKPKPLERILGAGVGAFDGAEEHKNPESVDVPPGKSIQFNSGIRGIIPNDSVKIYKISRSGNGMDEIIAFFDLIQPEKDNISASKIYLKKLLESYIPDDFALNVYTDHIDSHMISLENLSKFEQDRYKKYTDRIFVPVNRMALQAGTNTIVNTNLEQPQLAQITTNPDDGVSPDLLYFPYKNHTNYIEKIEGGGDCYFIAIARILGEILGTYVSVYQTRILYYDFLPDEKIKEYIQDNKTSKSNVTMFLLKNDGSGRLTIDPNNPEDIKIIRDRIITTVYTQIPQHNYGRYYGETNILEKFIERNLNVTIIYLQVDNATGKFHLHRELECDKQLKPESLISIIVSYEAHFDIVKIDTKYVFSIDKVKPFIKKYGSSDEEVFDIYNKIWPRRGG